MKNQSLWSLVALGALTTALSGTGVVAVFSDTATTGTNSVTSGDQPQPPPDYADLQIAEATGGGQDPIACGTFSDDLTSGLFSVTNLQVGQLPGHMACLKNAGTKAIAITMTAIDIVDIDTACSAGEAEAGDSTCGGDQQGELSYGLIAVVNRIDCPTGNPTSTAPPYVDLVTLSTTPLALPGDPLAPAETTCVYLAVNWSGNEQVLQGTQTDQVSWRFAFTGTDQQ